MGQLLNHMPLFLPAVIFGIAMLVESFLILKLHKQITPLPSMILNWISIGLAGKEENHPSFMVKNTPQNLRTYAFFTLIFGVLLLISSFIYLSGF